MILGCLVVNLRNPSLEVTPPPLDGSAEYCERIAVNGVSRLNFGSFDKVYRVLLKATTESSYAWYKRTQICFHRSPSLELCHCEKNDWRTSEDGVWSFVMSPYIQGILDIKYNSTIGDSLSISIEEVLQPWRYVFLVVGFALFFVAPAIEKYILSMVVADVKTHSINRMIRVIALSCIFQSSKDTRFAFAVIVCCLVIYGIRSIINLSSKDTSNVKKSKLKKL
ncbi:hypothetical protein CTI12_AA621990 [Artemisia annua]|uniref:Uncharacterized protein n=1 Tax=Artemisia annua TaxID=35608 RepID=A0A2U1KBL7_ARTAN|nr:hypothetical protein CTI12_AA621990 [Artemisia annua]